MDFFFTDPPFALRVAAAVLLILANVVFGHSIALAFGLACLAFAAMDFARHL